MKDEGGENVMRTERGTVEDMSGGRWKKNALIKRKQNFPHNKEIQKGAVAKSYIVMASSYMTKYLRISSYIRKPFSTAPI
jgi:hypothetical protein